jgi:hypothetical protein
MMPSSDGTSDEDDIELESRESNAWTCSKVHDIADKRSDGFYCRGGRAAWALKELIGGVWAWLTIASLLYHEHVLGDGRR